MFGGSSHLLSPLGTAHAVVRPGMRMKLDSSPARCPVFGHGDHARCKNFPWQSAAWTRQTRRLVALALVISLAGCTRKQGTASQPNNRPAAGAYFKTHWQ